MHDFFSDREIQELQAAVDTRRAGLAARRDDTGPRKAAEKPPNAVETDAPSEGMDGRLPELRPSASARDPFLGQMNQRHTGHPTDPCRPPPR